MKDLFNHVNIRIKKYSWVDIAQVKFAVFFFTLMLISLWNQFTTFILKFEWYWYLILTLFFSIGPAKKIFRK